MAVKTGLHGHASPDFTSEQILRVLTSFPHLGCFRVIHWSKHNDSDLDLKTLELEEQYEWMKLLG